MPEEEDEGKDIGLPNDEEKFKDFYASDPAEVVWRLFQQLLTSNVQSSRGVEQLLWEILPQKMQDRQDRLQRQQILERLSEEEEK